jgi:hypothetical protein
MWDDDQVNAGEMLRDAEAIARTRRGIHSAFSMEAALGLSKLAIDEGADIHQFGRKLIGVL